MDDTERLVIKLQECETTDDIEKARRIIEAVAALKAAGLSEPGTPLDPR